VDPTSGLNTTEAGGTAVFTLVLDSQPSSSLTIGVASTDTGEGVVSTSSVVFIPSKWNISQTVTISGVDDIWVDGHIEFNITTGVVSSSDTNYNGVTVGDVEGVTNMDGTAEVTLSSLHHLMDKQG
jgi:hypothetical protein